MRGEPGLLRRPVNMEEEYTVEEIQKFVLVPCDAAAEDCSVMPGQDFLQPGAAG